MPLFLLLSFFFFNDTATTEIYTLSLHDALPISVHSTLRRELNHFVVAHSSRLLVGAEQHSAARLIDRKSTRLNSSHLVISYAVFCLKKKNIDDGTRLLRIHCQYVYLPNRSCAFN